jgi:hypothetical protein
VDTQLRPTDPPFELQRTEIPQVLIKPLAIVESFHERKDLPTRLLPRVIRLMMHQFILQCAEEALGHGIVVAVALPAHTRCDTERGELETRFRVASCNPTFRGARRTFLPVGRKALVRRNEHVPCGG